MSAQIPLDDILAIEHLLSEDEKLARDTIRSWIKERYSPLLNQAHRDGVFPVEIIPEIAELGVFGQAIRSTSLDLKPDSL